MNAQQVVVVNIRGSARFVIAFPREVGDGERKYFRDSLRRLPVTFSYGLLNGNTIVLECEDENVTLEKAKEVLDIFLHNAAQLLKVRREEEIGTVPDHPAARNVIVCNTKDVRRYF